MSQFSSLLRALPRGRSRHARGYKEIRRRTRLVAAAFVAFGAILFTVGAWRAWTTFQEIQREEQLRAETLVSRAADRLVIILAGRFADLRFLGKSLLDSQAAPGALSSATKTALREFLRTHATISNVNILSPNGRRILWSAQPQSPKPLLAANQFHPLIDNPHLELGDAIFAHRFNTLVIPLRYRIRGPTGSVRFLVGDPLNLSKLVNLVPRAHFLVRLATTSGRPFAQWRHGMWRPEPRRAKETQGAGQAQAAVAGYPWTIQAQWSRTWLWHLWWRHVQRWLAIFVILLWGSQYMGILIVNLLSQEMQLRLWHQSLYHINRVSQKDPSLTLLFTEAAQRVQENLAASWVFIGSRQEHSIAPPAEAPPQHLLESAFEGAREGEWTRVGPDSPTRPLAIALGQSGAIIALLPSPADGTIPWHTIVQELAHHLTTAIHGRRQAAEIIRLQRYQAAVRIMQAELLRQPTPAQTYSLLVRVLVEQTDILGAFVASPEAGSSWLTIRAAAAQTPEMQDALLRLTPSQDPANQPFGQMLAGRAFRSGTPHGPIDPHQDKDLHAAMSQMPALRRIRAVVAYPILESGFPHPAAILVVEGADVNYFSPALRTLLEQLVASVRLSLNAYRTRRQTDRYRAFYEALARAGQVIARRGEPAQIFRSICQILAESTGVPLTFISLVDGGRARVTAVGGTCRDFLETQAPADDPEITALSTLHARGLATDGVCLFEKREQWLSSKELQAQAELLGLVSALTIPWVHKGQVAGLLGIVAYEREFFDEDIRRLVEAFGRDIGFAVSDHDQQQELLRLSLFDPLTALPNRAYFEKSAVSAIARAARSGQALALGIMDLDGFKEWNDLQGHKAGDDLLQSVSGLLREVVRKSEGVARLGGDEFGLAVSIDSLEALATLSMRLLTAVRQADPEKRVTASLGWATYSEGVTSYAALLIQADEALYAAKAAGRNTFRIFGGDIAERLTRRLKIHQRFPEALKLGQIVFFLQPQVHSGSGRVDGVELLARWETPEGTLPAGQFIPDVEKDARLIRALGRYALSQAVAVRARLREQGHELRVALNIGAHHFLHPGFGKEVRASLAGASAEGLCIEVTESVALSDARRAARVIGHLKDQGFSVALDDFGTGYSSLNEAAQLPVDELKLDQRFIHLFRRDPNAFAVAGATLLLASLSGRRLVAEGIETAEDLALWRHMGGEHLQGFYLSPPVPEGIFLTWLRSFAPTWAAPIAVFPPTDLILLGHAFLEPDIYTSYDSATMRASHVRIQQWMAARRHLYGQLPGWTALEGALAAATPSSPAHDGSLQTLRSAILTVYEEMAALLQNHKKKSS